VTIKLDNVKKENAKYPSLYHETESNNQRKIQKKIQLKNEIKRKISELKNELLRIASSSEKVMALNKEMETQWYEEQQIEDSVNNLEKRLMRLQEDLERKKYMKIEIEDLMNKHVGEKDTGIKSLDILYSVAQNENRSLALELDKLTREYDAASAELEKVKNSLTHFA
jgi:chromosome segregation ATPase